MRELLLEFWAVNYIPLYAAYGQVFFVLGLVVILSNHRQSLLPMARALWLLSLFAFIYALRQWGFIFIPIQAAYLPDTVLSTLEWTQLGLLATSFLFLMAFPVHLLVLCGRLRRWAWGLPVGLGLAWLGLLLLVYGVWQWSADQTFHAADLTARYGLALPAGLLAAWAMEYQRERVATWASERTLRWFRFLAFSFLALAVGEGLVTPPAPFFPADTLNYSTILHLTGMPIPVYRMGIALTLAFGARAAVALFEEEMQLRLRSLEQERMLLADRERISRELHDHTVQALYAIGLQVETACAMLREEPERVRRTLVQVMSGLNATIAEIRSYVYDLRQQGQATIPALIERALTHIQAHNLLDVDIHVSPSLVGRLLPHAVTSQLQAIIEEALSNVVKHGDTGEVVVSATDEEDSIIISIRDHGRGFDTTRALPGLGLRHMKERAHLMGAMLHVRSEPGHGTEIRIIVPLTEASEAVEYATEALASTASGRP